MGFFVCRAKGPQPEQSKFNMAVDIPGVISIIVFYILILAVGIWAGRKSAKSSSAVEAFLANRNMGLIVSFFTFSGK